MTTMTTQQTGTVTGTIKLLGVTMLAERTSDGKVYAFNPKGKPNEVLPRQVDKFEPAEDVHGTITTLDGRTIPATRRGSLTYYYDERGKFHHASGYNASHFVAN